MALIKQERVVIARRHAEACSDGVVRWAPWKLVTKLAPKAAIMHTRFPENTGEMQALPSSTWHVCRCPPSGAKPSL